MEKKEYIMPAVRVKAVNMLLMAALSNPNDEEGGDDQFSKGIELSDDNDNMVSNHDVWED